MSVAEGLAAAAKYIALMLAGYAAGRLTGVKPPSWLFTGIVAALILVVAGLAAEAFTGNPLGVILVSLAYTAAAIGASVAATLPLARVAGAETGAATNPPRGFTYTALAALATGAALGAMGLQPPPSLIDPLLAILVTLAGMDLAAYRGLRLEPWMLATPLATAAASIAAGLLLYTVTGVTPAVAAGLGWYTFTAPYLYTATHNPTIAAIALLANLAREQAAILTIPLAARRFPLPAAVAIGGVTTMDTTLPVYTASYGPRGTLAAAANGAILTLLVPILVPLTNTLAP